MKLKYILPAVLMRAMGLISHVAPQAGATLAFRAAMMPRRRKFRHAAADFRWRTPSGLRVHGWGDTGPLVLCLHGWESSGMQFGGLASHLKANGFRVWALDGLAHGESAGRLASPIDLLNGLRELHAMAGEPVSVVGHSMGAAMVMLAMREQVSFSRCVLVSGPTAFAEVFSYLNKALGLSPKSYDAFVRRIEAQMGRRLDSVDLSVAPPTDPALIIHDCKDKVIPVASSIALTRVWPRAELWVTDGLGHQGILKSEAVWERITDYLAQAQATRTDRTGTQGQAAPLASCA